MAVTEVGQILQDLSVIMVIAGGMAMLSWRLKQPLIVGYIGTGMIIGPHTPPFSLILNLDVLNLFAEIGIVLLLFVVGMEFQSKNSRKLEEKHLLLPYQRL
jgi:monovalent cation:H+ antiporter-2, CPA2 family